MVKKRTAIKIVLFFLSLSFLSVLLYISDIGKVATIISTANSYYAAFAFLLSLSLMALRAFRWKMLLEKTKIRAKFSDIFAVYMSGMLASNLTPGKIGEPFKNYMLKRTTGASISKTLPSVFMERIFDVFSSVILSFAGIVIITLPWNVEMALIGVVFLYMIAIIALIYISLKKSRIYSFSKKTLKLFWWFPFIKKLDKFLEGFAEKFKESLMMYKDFNINLKNLVLSLSVWIIEGLILYLCFISIGVNISIIAAVSFFSISMLVGVISMLPGGLGSSEVVMVFLFTGVYMMPIHTATAAVLLARFLGFWLGLFVGSLCLVSLKNLD